MSERHSISVAIALACMRKGDHRHLAGGVVLVQKRESLLWGLIAGHLEKEQPTDGICREILEETGLTKRQVRIEPTQTTYTVPGEDKTSFGIFFEGSTRARIPQKGYEPNSQEIRLVRPHLVEELCVLIANPELLYKPEFNVPFLSKVVVDYIATKYAFDSLRTQQTIARNWGISPQHIHEYLKY